MGYVYAFLDGDSIGERFADLLTKDQMFEATLLSENIKVALFEIDKLINSRADINVIILGGDDVLIRYDYNKYGTALLEEIRMLFKRHTGLSMSCGVGLNVEQSIINLDIAKTSGKNRIEKLSNLSSAKMPKLTTLYLFATSDIPDVYVNSIVYCSEDERYNLKEVCFLSITRDKGQKAEIENQLQEIKDKVVRQLQLLQVGKYLCRDSKTKQWSEREMSNMQSYQKLRYAQTNPIAFNFNVILYDSLEDSILNYKARNELCIFDFSAVLKSFMLDVYTILRVNHIDDIYIFELKKKGRTYNEGDLIHNLSLDHGEYEYVQLCKSAYTSRVIVTDSRKGDLSLGYVDTINKLIECYADEFARFWLFIIFLMAIAVLLICTTIVINDGWSWLEPWTFLGLGPALYVIALLSRVFWKRELSVSPDFLYNRFKISKSKQIKRNLKID
ncbi:mCpol domain-containing protein [Nodosilinea sp. AN01ver1]|uniref:mCpol domain-containing protein n=1 Tax=Nodosilinea sp. AN01ver1 TaxID=3423362 RepID=UPI003D31D9A1